MRVFDKTLYAGSPPAVVPEVLEKLASLGDAVVAARGLYFSTNLLGPVYVGEDGGDPVLRVRKCDCHVHVMWDKIHGYRLAREDVGYGPEPVVYLLGEDGEPVVNLFYPEKTFEEVEFLLK